MRESVVLARERLGFQRMGIWLLDEGGESATGTFGVDLNGRIVDERTDRIFDNSGYIREMLEEWSQSPHYCERLDARLISAEAKNLGQGTHITAPLFHQGEIRGFIGVDDLIETSSVNDRCGPLLCQFAEVVSHAYFFRVLQDELGESTVAVSEAERVQNEFLSVLGHEVRNPLNAILGHAQLLRSRYKEKEIVDVLNTIEECGGHVNKLINSVLEYSHLTSDELKRWYEPGDPVEVLEYAVKSLSGMYSLKGLDLDMSFEGDRSLVYFDAVSLRQIVTNLLQNALKFTEKGGVRVSAFSRSRRQKTEFYVEVSDTGIGMSPEDLSGIFEPFNQVRSSHGSTSAGIGMGLAIVRRLVRAMKGSITCQSVNGKGSVFCLGLDFENVISENTSDIETRFGNSSTFSRVLIVEDDEANLRLIRTMTHRLGFMDTDFARDGEEARLLLAEHPYDLVLMDIQMPRLDGLSLTRLVRSGRTNPINRTVPIVAVTSMAGKHDRDECLMAGMTDFITKPVMVDSLRRALELA